MEECSLTYRGKRLVELEPTQFGVVDEQMCFTNDQVVQALCAQSILFLQTGGPDTDDKTVTSEIELLLRAQELIKSDIGRESLFIDNAA